MGIFCTFLKSFLKILRFNIHAYLKNKFYTQQQKMLSLFLKELFIFKSFFDIQYIFKCVLLNKIVIL